MAGSGIIKQAQTIDAVTGNVYPMVPEKRLRVPLTTVRDARRKLGRVYRDMKANRIEADKGSRLCYVLFNLGKLIEMSELEARIVELEKQNGASAPTLTK